MHKREREKERERERERQGDLVFNKLNFEISTESLKNVSSENNATDIFFSKIFDLYILSRPAVPTSVINKFVIANVRWCVDAEFELHERHDERAGARARGILLVVTARKRYTHASSRVFEIANFTNDNVFCHSLNLSKEVVYFTEAIYSAGKVRLHELTWEVREVF